MTLIEQVEEKIRAMSDALDDLAKEIAAMPANTLQEKLDRHACEVHARAAALTLRSKHAYVERLHPRG